MTLFTDLDFLVVPRRISLEAFERLCEAVVLSRAHQERARKVLVDGRPVREVAAEEGITEEAVRLTCRRLVGRLRQEWPILTDNLFEAAANQFPRISDCNRALARRVLVDEESIAAVAQDAGLSASVLTRVVRKIRDAVIPEGWRVVNVALPANEADQVEKRAEEAYANLVHRLRSPGRE